MRLLKWDTSGSLTIEEFLGDNLPSYAILSHTWGSAEEEITYNEVISNTPNMATKNGYSKIRFCGDQATRDGLKYFWVDSCCIDKSSSAELAEALNSMFRWYRDSKKCYVYLSDVSVSNLEPSFRRSRWFTRGWTLQELLAPNIVEFFSKEELRLGDKRFFASAIWEITGIPLEAVCGDKALNNFAVSERMYWAKGRQTTRKEDEAYCLLGIFGIHLSPIYGERENAFIRLQDEINKRALDYPPMSSPGNVSQLKDNSITGESNSSSLVIRQQRSAPESNTQRAEVKDINTFDILILTPGTETIYTEDGQGKRYTWVKFCMERVSNPTMIDRVGVQHSSPKEAVSIYDDLPEDSMRDAIDKAIKKHSQRNTNQRHEWVLVRLAVMSHMSGLLSRRLVVTQIKVYLQGIPIESIVRNRGEDQGGRTYGWGPGPVDVGVVRRKAVAGAVTGGRKTG